MAPQKQGSNRQTAPQRRHGATGLRTVFEVSAGGIVHRMSETGIEVCLISTRGGTRWQLPKGRQERGESLGETAVREVAEETGLEATLGPPLDTLELWYTWTENGEPVRHHKMVHLFLLTYVSGNTSDHDGEVDDAAWCTPTEALTRLTFPSERRVLRRALALLDLPAADLGK